MSGSPCIRAAVILLLTLLSLLPAWASDAGTGYARLDNPLPPEEQDPSVVVQVFWYGCPDCGKLESQLDGLTDATPNDLSVRRMPAVAPRWEPHARAYYAADALGKLERFHSELSEAMQRDRRQLMSKADLIAFASEIGLDAAAFRAAYESPEVERQFREAADLTERYQIRGVPALVVNGTYRTDLQLAGDHSSMMETVEQLLRRQDPVSDSRRGRNRPRP